MVQWTTYFFVKGMVLWNTLTDFFFAAKHHVVDFTSHVTSYFRKSHSTWYLLPHHSLPIHQRYIKNKIEPCWRYNGSSSTLVAHNVEEPTCYTINWLSASLRIQSQIDMKWDEYPMDDFLQDLVIMSNEQTLPTLKELFLVWCIHTHHWFSSSDTVIFQVIDHDAEFHLYDITNPRWVFSVADSRLRIAPL
jgi:hypothetical protein